MDGSSGRIHWLSHSRFHCQSRDELVSSQLSASVLVKISVSASRSVPAPVPVFGACPCACLCSAWLSFGPISWPVELDKSSANYCGPLERRAVSGIISSWMLFIAPAKWCLKALLLDERGRDWLLVSELSSFAGCFGRKWPRGPWGSGNQWRLGLSPMGHWLASGQFDGDVCWTVFGGFRGAVRRTSDKRGATVNNNWPARIYYCVWPLLSFSRSRLPAGQSESNWSGRKSGRPRGAWGRRNCARGICMRAVGAVGARLSQTNCS